MIAAQLVVFAEKLFLGFFWRMRSIFGAALGLRGAGLPAAVCSNASNPMAFLVCIHVISMYSPYRNVALPCFHVAFTNRDASLDGS